MKVKHESIWKWLSTGLITSGLTLNGIFLGIVIQKLDRIDGKLFHHLTNDAIHTPREQIVPRGEFKIFKHYQDERDEKIAKELRGLREAILKRRK